MNWYLEAFKKYAVFDGRAHRTEFWLFSLFSSMVYFSLGAIAELVGSLWFIVPLYAVDPSFPLSPSVSGVFMTQTAAAGGS